MEDPQQECEVEVNIDIDNWGPKLSYIHKIELKDLKNSPTYRISISLSL